MPSPHDAEGRHDEDLWQPPGALATLEAPRWIIANHFPSSKGGLPIRGGWGYTQASACILCRDDPLNAPGIPVDGAAIEHAFVEKRCYAELILFRAKGDAHRGIGWTLERQALVSGADGRKYDRFMVEIACFRERDWDMLKAEYALGRNTPEFDVEAFRCRQAALKRRYLCEYWFDITSFFGR